jgi:hypothetical protein
MYSGEISPGSMEVVGPGKLISDYSSEADRTFPDLTNVMSEKRKRTTGATT